MVHQKPIKYTTDRRRKSGIVDTVIMRMMPTRVLISIKEALMCRRIMVFRYSHVCRVHHAHHESTACNFFSVRTAHPTLVH